MSKHHASSSARAEHCRELAEWTDDARTQHILLDLAREFETEDTPEPPVAEEPRAIPPTLS